MDGRDKTTDTTTTQIPENNVVGEPKNNSGETGLGNTITSPASQKPAKKKQSNQLMNWFFTWNNYPDNFLETLETLFKKICKRYIFQKEMGSNGTPHIQGTICLKKAMRWEEFKLPKEIHWEKTLHVESAFAYCSKTETRVGTEVYRWPVIVEKAELRIISNLKPWQSSVMDIIKPDIPDERTIHWVFDENGCMGKTVFSKYLYSKENAIIATGGASKDIACLIAGLAKEGRDLNAKTTFVFNFPRSTEGVSWKAIEMVKDGLITSPKYESSTLVFNCPHVICFSNEMPDLNKLSSDRWMIWKIINEELIPYPGFENKSNQFKEIIPTIIITEDKSEKFTTRDTLPVNIDNNLTIEDMYVNQPNFNEFINKDTIVIPKNSPWYLRM